MANIKISELNALTERADNDLLAIVDTSADETKKIQVSDLVNKNIELIAVSDTAPSECSIGDKYYNTTDKEIYTATGTNTWSETGTTPINGILYIVYNEQASYSWDGTDLVSVGGGKEDIVIDDEEPIDPDVKLWIDTGEVESLGSELPLVYPVGSIYMSVNNTNPATLFGFGTWEQIKDTFLLSAGNTYSAGATGGSSTHTLTTDEIPSHSHVLKSGYSGGTWARGNFGFVANVGNDGQKNTMYFDDTNRTTTTGGGQSFNIMPPYLVVYMWKRTA